MHFYFLLKKINYLKNMGNKNSKSDIPVSQINYCYGQENIQAPIQQQGLTKIPQNDDPSKPLLSVIVTIFSGSSYDDLFRQVPQVAPGGRISLYSLSLDFVTTFLNDLKSSNESKDDAIRTLMKEMDEVSPDAILYNFECCSGCNPSDYHFPQKESTIDLINFALERGNMVMCSDFAVKALINDWSEKLGPNPFVKLGECNDYLELFFESKVLQESPSKQLQMVGQLCETGTTTIHALGGTVVFGLNKKNLDNKIYQLSVYTIVTKTNGIAIDKTNPNYGRVGDQNGPVGHALLKYNTGGLLLVSAGHWIELAHLNVNIENLESAAKMNYGEANEYMGEIENIKNIQDQEVKKTKMNYLAKQFVQQTAACNYSSKSYFPSKK